MWCVIPLWKCLLNETRFLNYWSLCSWNRRTLVAWWIHTYCMWWIIIEFCFNSTSWSLGVSNGVHHIFFSISLGLFLLCCLFTLHKYTYKSVCFHSIYCKCLHSLTSIRFVKLLTYIQILESDPKSLNSLKGAAHCVMSINVNFWLWCLWRV